MRTHLFSICGTPDTGPLIPSPGFPVSSSRPGHRWRGFSTALAWMGMLLLTMAVSPALHANDNETPLYDDPVYLKNDVWSFTITKVERVAITEKDARDFPGAAAKWHVTTKLMNVSKTPQILLAVPAYAATVNGILDESVFTGGSHYPLKSRDEDFITVVPNNHLLAKHCVVALRVGNKNAFILEGFFLENINVSEPLKANNFPWTWFLLSTPTRNEFELSISLFDQHYRPEVVKLLGKDYAKFWRGKIKTSAVKMKVFESWESEKAPSNAEKNSDNP